MNTEYFLFYMHIYNNSIFVLRKLEISRTGNLAYMGRKVIRGFAIADRSCMRSVTFFGIIAKVGLKGKPSEHEQRRDDRWFVKGMVRMEALHPAAMPDDIVAQLQVIVMPCRLIAETATRVFEILNKYIIKKRSIPL